MKILHTIPSMSRASGGPSSCTYNLVRALNDGGTPTDIVTTDSDDNISADPFIHYTPDDLRTPLAISPAIGRWIDTNINNYSLIHTNCLWLWSSHQGARAARRRNIPYVISPHGMLYPEGLKVSAWKKKIVLPLFQRRDLRRAACLHATCDAEMQHIRAFGLRQPVAVIPNGIVIDHDPVVRETVNTRRQIGFVGRINPYKNIHLLLEAWHRIGHHTADADLHIIGSGDAAYEATLRQYVADNHLDNVYFDGFKSGAELENAIHALDWLVLPSRTENFGMVVAEALVQRVPVIASHGTPWAELNTSHCGQWLDDTPDALADALINALTVTETDRRQMGTNGHALVMSKYTIQSVAARMVALYRWLLDGSDNPDFVYTI